MHAEVNAIIIAGRSAAGGTIYVHGAPVCPRCAGVVIQAGVKRVVAKTPHCEPSAPSATCSAGINWNELGLIALKMLAEAKVDFDPIGDTDEREISK